MTSAWFWKNYDICRRWQNMHRTVVKEVADVNGMLERCHISSDYPQIVRNPDYGQCYYFNQGKITGSSHPVDDFDESNDYMPCDQDDDFDCVDIDHESDPEVHEEYMAFLEETRKHRLELKEKREQELESMKNPKKKTKKNKKENRREKKGNRREKKEEESIGTDEDKEESHLAPACPVGKLRSEEVSLLYGSAAQRIQGMETAMQLTFNKKCDSSKPTFWPVVPLNTNLS